MGKDRRSLRHLPPCRGGSRLTLPGPGAVPFTAGDRSELAARPFGLYVHVPFCASRCGYCDFVTYTVGELGGTQLRDGYADAAIAEIRLAADALGAGRPPTSTVFFGGGTPTMLPTADLARILDAARQHLGLTPDAEITIEANPDSVDRRGLAALRAAGFTRVSFGMQSVRAHVLTVLDRTHTPGRAQAAVADAHAVGFAHVNLDLIYGTPGEREVDWRATLDAAIGAAPDHVAAYALTVEPRTRLAARVRRGDLPAPDDDVLAARYEIADDVLTAAGYSWYEVSNWARSDAAQCAHNLLYWRDHHWWGVGPGAHSHVGPTRWWNVREPARHAAAVHAGALPVEGWERSDAAARWLERVLLGVRVRDGLAADPFDATTLGRLAEDALLEPGPLAHGRVVLTRRGRMLTDSVVRALVADGARASAACVESPMRP